ncbi:MAG: peptide deformylase [Candidatus Thorarchaeota archaeon]|jgi:peptide deformylase
MKIVPVDEIPKNLENTPTSLMELFKIFQKIEILCDKEGGIGLSAVQVGIPWRLFVVYHNPGYGYYVDCEYTGIGEKGDSVEGCLSIKNEDGSFKNYKVQRYSKIQLVGKMLEDDGDNLVLVDVDKTVSLEDDKIYTIVFQHEIDHHHNILISDIGEPIHVRKV